MAPRRGDISLEGVVAIAIVVFAVCWMLLGWGLDWPAPINDGGPRR